MQCDSLERASVRSSLHANSVASHSLPETTNCDISLTPKPCVNSLFPPVGCGRLRLLLGPSTRPDYLCAKSAQARLNGVQFPKK